MEKSETKLGMKVVIPSKNITICDFDINGCVASRKIIHQKEKVLYIRENHNDIVCGVSYSLDTPAKDSMGVMYEFLTPIV